MRFAELNPEHCQLFHRPVDMLSSRLYLMCTLHKHLIFGSWLLSIILAKRKDSPPLFVKKTNRNEGSYMRVQKILPSVSRGQRSRNPRIYHFVHPVCVISCSFLQSRNLYLICHFLAQD